MNNNTPTRYQFPAPRYSVIARRDGHTIRDLDDRTAVFPTTGYDEAAARVDELNAADRREQAARIIAELRDLIADWQQYAGIEDE